MATVPLSNEDGEVVKGDEGFVPSSTRDSALAQVGVMLFAACAFSRFVASSALIFSDIETAA